ncbi:MAG: GntR family transcriptional regulator [Alphaproteobacteria bacterium]
MDIPTQTIEAELEKVFIHAMPFGKFWINERIASEFFGVSRTIIRELLFKFQQRSLISKDDNSHWTVGPLTAAILQHQYEVRHALEPLALRGSSQTIELTYLSQLIEDLKNNINAEHMNPEDIKKIEYEFHYGIHKNNPNKMLLKMLYQVQTPLLIKQTFLELVGIENASQTLNEHLAVLTLVRWGAIDAACEALKFHIETSANKMYQRLKAFSVLPRPDFPPYLREI